MSARRGPAAPARSSRSTRTRIGAFNPYYRVDHVLEMPIKRYNLADSKAEAERLIDEALELVGLRCGRDAGPLSL